MENATCPLLQSALQPALPPTDGAEEGTGQVGSRGDWEGAELLDSFLAPKANTQLLSLSQCSTPGSYWSNSVELV